MPAQMAEVAKVPERKRSTVSIPRESQKTLVKIIGKTRKSSMEKGQSEKDLQL